MHSLQCRRLTCITKARVNDGIDSGIVAIPSRAGVPSLSTYKVALVARPGDAVLTTSAIGIGDRACAVGPEGVIIPSASTSATGRRTSKDLTVVARDGKGSNDGRRGEEDGLERDHCWTVPCRFRGQMAIIYRWTKLWVVSVGRSSLRFASSSNVVCRDPQRAGIG